MFCRNGFGSSWSSYDTGTRIAYGLIQLVLVRHRYLRVKPDEYQCRTDTENTLSLIKLIPVLVPNTIHSFIFSLFI
ncbi:hypothetical protein HanRHA438_Chr15g0734641 [Helianthus annuus]|nr:hypothetical protein HanRHA438_Chr15g0734641 [Helianthus annuus]